MSKRRIDVQDDGDYDNPRQRQRVDSRGCDPHTMNQPLPPGAVAARHGEEPHNTPRPRINEGEAVVVVEADATFNKAKETFDNNEYADNVALQTPHENSTENNVEITPPLGPKHFQNQTEKGVRLAIGVVQRRFKVEEQVLADESEDSFEAHGEIHRVTETHVNGWNKKVFENFVRGLPFCVYLTKGFDCEESQCFCPCSKLNEKWRKLFDIRSSSSPCNNNRPLAPSSLKDHLKSVGNGKKCLFHQATLKYLEIRYQDYWDEELPHVAFLTPNKRDFNRAKLLERERLKQGGV